MEIVYLHLDSPESKHSNKESVNSGYFDGIPGSQREETGENALGKQGKQRRVSFELVAMLDTSDFIPLQSLLEK